MLQPGCSIVATERQNIMSNTWLIEQLLSDKALCMPQWMPNISSRSELDAQGLQLPLLVIWGVRDGGQNLDMTVSVNSVRLLAELRHRLLPGHALQTLEQAAEDADSALANYAQELLNGLVTAGLPVPLCLEREARAALLNHGTPSVDRAPQ